MAADLDLKMTLKAIDKASAPIRAVGRAFTDLRQRAGIADLATIGTRLKGIGTAAGYAGLAAGGLAAGAFALIKTQIIDVASEFENLNVRLEALTGSQEGAKQALDWVKDFAQATPLELREVVEAFAQLKTYGIDPTNGSLLALVDAMAKQGKGAEQLSGLITAVGQAWTKQKLQGEEIMQLMERGIPVWDLLAKATGKSIPVLQKLSEKGKLGRKEIALLLQAIGKDAAGASEKFSKTWTGVLSNLRDAWTNFVQMVGEAGIFELFKNQLTGLLDTVNKMQADGSLKALAVDIGTGMVDAAKALIAFVPRLRDGFRDVAAAAQWLRENFGWLLDVGKAFYDVIAWQWRQITAVAQAVAAAFDAVSGAIGRLPKLPDWLPKLLGMSLLPGGLAAGALGAAAPTLSSAGSSLVSRIEGAIGINITGAPKGTSVSASSSTPGLVLAPTLGPGMLGHI